MSWREQLLPASFRGAEFVVDRHDADFARRLAVHEYPGRDLPETEDLGERATTLDVDAYVIGDAYMSARDALEAALRKAGPGELSHPWLGKMQAVAIGFRLTESSREGGMARFAIRFIRYSEIVPRVEVDTQRAAVAAAAAVQAAAAPQFAAAWPSPAGIRDAVTSAINSAFGPLEALIGTAEDWRTTLQLIINQPLAIAARLQAGLARVRTLADFRSLWLYYDDSSPSAIALSQQLQVSAVSAAAAWSATFTAPSYDDAIAMRDELLAQMDVAAQRAGDELYQGLQALRAATAADIEARSANLARLARYTPRTTLPALVIAHRLYGAADIAARTSELVARNAIEHPGFVTGGTELEVLSE